MAEERRNLGRHTVIMEQREQISITGVVDVLSFDEESIVCDTEMGVLLIQGTGLHVNKLSLESGEIYIDGEIDSLGYSEGRFGKDKGSFFSKLFK